MKTPTVETDGTLRCLVCVDGGAQDGCDGLCDWCDEVATIWAENHWCDACWDEADAERAPICDLCDEPMEEAGHGYEVSEWNGETGRHVVCEEVSA